MSPTDWDRIGRYLAGESSPEEAAAVQRWLEEHPSDAKLVATLEAATAGLNSSQRVDVEHALRVVKTRMHAPAPATAEPAALAPRVSFRRYATFAAAAALVVAVGVLVARRTTPMPRAVPAQAYATGVGERRDLRLADGTEVILGPASRLTVRERAVELQGEALFRVVHDPRRPFSVAAGGARIRDVGTSFTVHSDPGETLRVVVGDGIVALTHGSDSVTLARGDVGTLDSAGSVAAKRGAATSDDLAWTRGQLVFRNASVAELVADLRRWYGVELRVTSADTALMRRHFTGTFAPGREPASQVLNVVALALGARVEHRGDTVFLRATNPSK